MKYAAGTEESGRFTLQNTETVITVRLIVQGLRERFIQCRCQRPAGEEGVQNVDRDSAVSPAGDMCGNRRDKKRNSGCNCMAWYHHGRNIAASRDN